MGLNHLPSGRFAANAAWMAIQVMAHNLARWTARIGLGEQVMTTKTLRRRFFSLARRLTRSARRLTPASATGLALGNAVRSRTSQTASHSITGLTTASQPNRRSQHSADNPTNPANSRRFRPRVPRDCLIAQQSRPVATVGLLWRPASRLQPSERPRRWHLIRTDTFPRPSPTLRQRYDDSSVDSGLNWVRVSRKSGLTKYRSIKMPRKHVASKILPIRRCSDFPLAVTRRSFVPRLEYQYNTLTSGYTLQINGGG